MTEVERVRSFVRDMKKRLKAHEKRWNVAYQHAGYMMGDEYCYDSSNLDAAFKTVLEVAKVMDRTEKLSRRTDKGATKR